MIKLEFFVCGSRDCLKSQIVVGRSKSAAGEDERGSSTDRGVDLAGDRVGLIGDYGYVRHTTAASSDHAAQITGIRVLHGAEEDFISNNDYLYGHGCIITRARFGNFSG